MHVRMHTRLVSRPHRRRTLLAAAVVAIGANFLLVAVLSQMASIAPESPAMVGPLMALNVVPLPTPPATPPPEVEASPDPLPVPAPVAPAPPPLPALDLPAPPAVPSDSALVLPRFEPGVNFADLPAAIPPYTAADSRNPAMGQSLPEDDAPSPQQQMLGMIVPPQLLNSPHSARFYPRTARARGIEGHTSMRVDVGENGRASAIEILASEPPGVFDEAAKRFGRELRFRPATHDGQPIAGSVTLEIYWRLDD